MDPVSYRTLVAFNREMKKLDDIYRSAAKECGMAECAFWILYTLRVEALSSGADQRSKLVQLTPKGEQLACERVDRIPEAEAAALRAMRPKDRAAFICLTRQYRLLLEQQFRESKSKGGTPPEPAAQK